MLFDVQTPLGFHVTVTQEYWDVIVNIKHPVMRGKEKWVQKALEHPDEVRKSKSDGNVFLFYKNEKMGRWVCAVSKRQGEEGFLITAYPTDAIKEGEKVWPR